MAESTSSSRKGILDRFHIRVDSNGYYSKTGSYQTLRQLHTKNGILYPTKDLSRYIHPVISAMGHNANAFRNISSFPNSSEGLYIGSSTDGWADLLTPIVSGRLYKAGVDYPVMHPSYVAALNSFKGSVSASTSSSTGWVELLTNSNVRNSTNGDMYISKTYTMNCYGSTDGTLPPAGVLAVQGGGGGGGGADNKDSDCAGGGGGSGGGAWIYYRIKNNPNGTVTLTIQAGAKGGGGPNTSSGSGKSAWAGGQSVALFTTPQGTVYGAVCDGGGGGTGGNYNYASGGSGGTAYASVNGTAIMHSWGGGGGADGSSGSGSPAATSGFIYEDDYIYLYSYRFLGGSGGGCGDDTDGGTGATAGAGKSAFTLSFPRVDGTSAYSVSWPERGGGSRGTSVSDAAAGGGGASAWCAGRSGQGKSSSGYEGAFGCGASGASVGDNACRGGVPGGAGFVWLLQYS